MGKDDPHAVPTTVTLVERGATTEVTLRILFGSKEERDEKVAKYYAAQARSNPWTAWRRGSRPRSSRRDVDLALSCE